MPDTVAYRELSKSLQEIQNKHCYFLLATAAAAIALSVRATAEASLSWSQLPLGLAVLSWGMSFYYGCRFMTNVDIVTSHTLTDMQIQAGELPYSKEPNIELDYRAVAKQVYEDSVKSLSESAKNFNRRQFRLLVAGAVLFVGWHVLEMGIRTSPTAPFQTAIEETRQESELQTNNHLTVPGPSTESRLASFKNASHRFTRGA